MRLFFITILGAVLLSNTFSPQYLIWIAPFVAFLSTAEILMFVGASSLTWMYFRYWNDLVQLAPIATGLLIARNLLLLILLIVSVIIVVRDIYRMVKTRA